jgi:ribonuclease I
MSIYLAQEMIVGFCKTNNPLCFHSFADKIYQETVQNQCLATQDFSFTTHGGWNGTFDDNMVN